MSKLEEQLSRAIISLLVEDPFFAHLLGSIPRDFTEKIEKMGLMLTPIGPRLLINENYFLKELRTEAERVAAIKHEALHVAFLHYCRCFPDKVRSVMDLSADLVVNQFLKAPIKLKDPVLLKSFPKLSLKPNETLDYYYKILIKYYNPEMEANQSGSKDGDSLENGSNKNVNNTGSGSSDKDLNKNALAQLIQARNGSHEFWGQVNDESIYAMENLVIRARERTPSREWGKIPGPINDWIEMLIEQRQPKVDWKRQLRLFGASSQRTKVLQTIRRISKRYGTRPGIRVKRKQKLLIAIDTSGSIDQDALDLFFSEVHAMWQNGAEIEVVECDSQVQRVYSYNGTTPKEISGGGGTDFDPVFSYTRRNRKVHYDGLIYLTDGYADVPTIKPPCRLLWVITPGGTKENIAFGNVIEIK